MDKGGEFGDTQKDLRGMGYHLLKLMSGLQLLFMQDTQRMCAKILGLE